MVARRSIELPDKVYFRIGEVAHALNLRPHVVRFWQKEFPSIRPERSRSGRFLYTRTTVEHIALIRALLHDEGYTIQGARKAIRERSRTRDAEPPTPQPAAAPVDDGRIAALEEALANAQKGQRSAEAKLAALEARHGLLCDAIAREGARVLAALGDSAQG